MYYYNVDDQFNDLEIGDILLYVLYIEQLYDIIYVFNLIH